MPTNAARTSVTPQPRGAGIYEAQYFLRQLSRAISPAANTQKHRAGASRGLLLINVTSLPVHLAASLRRIWIPVSLSLFLLALIRSSVLLQCLPADRISQAPLLLGTIYFKRTSREFFANFMTLIECSSATASYSMSFSAQYIYPPPLSRNSSSVLVVMKGITAVRLYHRVEWRYRFCIETSPPRLLRETLFSAWT